MKSLLHQLDAAIGSIYSIATDLKAQDFLIPPKELIPSGALLVHSHPETKTDVEVAIVFNPKIQSQFKMIEQTPFAQWDQELTQAFAVATEEVSHFRFFIFHSEQDRPVSQLEMEFQGELDKFLLFYFLAHSEIKPHTISFEDLFEKLFEHFSLQKNITVDKQERYLLANQLAKEFIHKHRHYFKSPERHPDLFQELRALYRMSSGDKFGFKNRL